MVESTSFFGMPIRTRRQRRLLVAGYYSFLALFGGLALWRGGHGVMYVMPQILTLGGLLGGIRLGGPVKFYADNGMPRDGSGVQTLNLSGRKPFSLWPGGEPLDEREREERNQAHFRAFRILLWSLGIVSCAYWFSMNWTAAWVGTRLPALLWVLLVYALSLPQAVILWTEPGQPSADILTMPPWARDADGKAAAPRFTVRC